MTVKHIPNMHLKNKEIYSVLPINFLVKFYSSTLLTVL